MDEPYAAMLRLAGCTARVDVVSGTSAVGSTAQRSRCPRSTGAPTWPPCATCWVEQGRIEALLRQPFRGAPSSLLKGDEHFLPQLNAALTSLAVPTDVVPPRDAPIDLTMMTTVLNGNQQVTVDGLGQRLPQSVHSARFHWKRPVDVLEEDDPFGLAKIRDTAAQMALAARGSSSFPLAFEPAFVPVSPLEGAVPGTPSQTSDLRPDMGDVVEDWGDVFPARNRSRFVVDGGALANTPTKAAVEAIERMPADGPVRRVMLLVYPHAPEPGLDPADTLADAPTLTGRPDRRARCALGPGQPHLRRRAGGPQHPRGEPPGYACRPARWLRRADGLGRDAAPRGPRPPAVPALPPATHLARGP